MEVREGGECTEVRSTREGSNRSVLVAFAAPLPTTRAVLLAISGGSQEAVREVAGGWGWGIMDAYSLCQQLRSQTERGLVIWPVYTLVKLLLVLARLQRTEYRVP